MRATYEKINGVPTLRLEKTEGYFGMGKRMTVDVPLLPEQARSIEVYMGVRP